MTDVIYTLSLALEDHFKNHRDSLFRPGWASDEWDRLYALWIQARWDRGDAWVRTVWPSRPSSTAA